MGDAYSILRQDHDGDFKGEIFQPRWSVVRVFHSVQPNWGGGGRQNKKFQSIELHAQPLARCLSFSSLFTSLLATVDLAIMSRLMGTDYVGRCHWRAHHSMAWHWCLPIMYYIADCVYMYKGKNGEGLKETEREQKAGRENWPENRSYCIVRINYWRVRIVRVPFQHGPQNVLNLFK